MSTPNVKPIGRVRHLSEDRSALEIAPPYRQGADGIEPGGRVQVLYWMHKLAPHSREALKVHPRGDKARPRQGVFGLRSPMRPNPIGVSMARVERVEGSRLVVSGLDALDGSPLVDIKGSRGRGEVRRLVATWGRIHDAIVSRLGEELGAERVREMLHQPMWELGQGAAAERRDDAEAIGREIMGFEASWDIEGRVLEAGPERFVREVTDCPWAYFRPLSCRVLAWWMEGFCEGLNERFRYSLEKLIPEGAASCVWQIARKRE
ncbi:MAG: tRNA (N6-threonylcarbamoyladenosine(37)-N6)-methyltransferase TrmO [bacterium]